MNFFETHQRELYKTWLIEEIGKNFGSTSPRSIQNSPVKKSHGNAASSILDEYLDVISIKFLIFIYLYLRTSHVMMCFLSLMLKK